MKTMTITLLVTLGALAACGQKFETAATAPASGAANQTGAMASMAPAPQVGKMVKGKGTVTAIDAKAGTVTLDHEAIPEAGWPAMTMSFSAPTEVVAKVVPGEKVAFDLRIGDMGGTITGIEKQ